MWYKVLTSNKVYLWQISPNNWGKLRHEQWAVIKNLWVTLSNIVNSYDYKGHTINLLLCYEFIQLCNINISEFTTKGASYHGILENTQSIAYFYCYDPKHCCVQPKYKKTHLTLHTDILNIRVHITLASLLVLNSTNKLK